MRYKQRLGQMGWLLMVAMFLVGCGGRDRALHTFYGELNTLNDRLIAADALDAMAVLGATGGNVEAAEGVHLIIADLKQVVVPDDPDAQALYDAMMVCLEADLEYLEHGGTSVQINTHIFKKINTCDEKNKLMEAFAERIGYEE